MNARRSRRGLTDPVPAPLEPNPETPDFPDEPDYTWESFPGQFGKGDITVLTDWSGDSEAEAEIRAYRDRLARKRPIGFAPPEAT